MTVGRIDAANAPLRGGMMLKNLLGNRGGNETAGIIGR